MEGETAEAGSEGERQVADTRLTDEAPQASDRKNAGNQKQG